MSKSIFITPKNYRPLFSLKETETAIKTLKDYFEKELADVLHLNRVSAPLFVFSDTGLNDNLNGTEAPVSFQAALAPEKTLEIIHSLAKWKRMALHRYGFQPGEGLYTDMNAIRKDEVLSNLHSIYVDQWDWEIILPEGQRTKDFLKQTVRKIFSVFKKTEAFICSKYPQLEKIGLPEDIHFVTTQELEDTYPDLTPKERENAIAKKYGAVFIMQIGDKLKSGQKHDGRSPDYDDWQLNGDIVFWNPVLEYAFELSSMGIRVDAESLKNQSEKAGTTARLNFPFHEMILKEELPLTMGGGIGQSRICMYFLKKAHIGEVQTSIWDAETEKKSKEFNISLL